MHTCSRSSFTVKLHLSRKWWSGRTSSNRTTGHNLSSEHTLTRPRMRPYLSCIHRMRPLLELHTCSIIAAGGAIPHLLLCSCACQSHLLPCSRAPRAPTDVQLRLLIPPSSLIPTVRNSPHTSAFVSIRQQLRLPIPPSALFPAVRTSIAIMLVPHMLVPPSPLKTRCNNRFSQ